MAINKTGGNKTKKQKNTNKYDKYRNCRIIEGCKEHDNHYYARVKSRLGGQRLSITVFYGDELVETSSIIRGVMQNKVWMNANDIIVVYYDGNRQCEVVGKVSDNNIINQLLIKESKNEHDVIFTDDIDDTFIDFDDI